MENPPPIVHDPLIHALQTLGEAVPDFVWACKADGTPLFVNPRWSEYTGLALGQPNIPPMNVLHHPEDYPGMVEIMRAATARGEPFETEFRYRRYDGAYRWFMARAVPVKDDKGHILQWIGTSTDIHERKMAETERAYVLSAARCLLWYADIHEEDNPLFLRWIMHIPDTEAAQRFLPLDILPEQSYATAWYLCRPEEDRERCNATAVAAIRAGKSYQQDFRCRAADGTLRWLHEDIQVETLLPGAHWRAVGVCTDITERKRLEEQLLQAQKMEGFGRLAGGIAHDFNNLLTAITGYTELAMEDLAADSGIRGYLENVRKASERAANLTGQLLAFARKQIIVPRTLSLNKLIQEVHALLRRLIGEDIEVVSLLTDDLWPVSVDPGQFEQILINLAVNARDAMVDGGKLTLETHNVTLDAEYARVHPDVTPGDYVMLAVSDTGIGMEEAVQQHIFEPFFTTKEPGKGTGLGLATCHGIVQQNGGHIWLYSEPGRGTTFKIYLRRVQADDVAPLQRETRRLPRGTETILLVEDEPMVRNMAAAALRMQGYHLLQASAGSEALRIVAEFAGTIHLLLTDVVMPQMSGKQLVERLMTLRPKIKVLYASGYTDNTIVHHGVLDAGVAFLQKPYSPITLAMKVREVLDQER